MISVIIPGKNKFYIKLIFFTVLNEAENLRETLHRVFQGRNIEVIIVDGGKPTCINTI